MTTTAARKGRDLGAGALGALRAELRPRLKELRYSLHLLRKSLLAMIGLAIVLTFVVLAVVGPALAPYPFTYNASEKNGPPGERPIVYRNESARIVAGSGWGYRTVQDLANDDDIYARSDNLGDTLLLRQFELGVYTNLVTFVGVTAQYNSTEGFPGSRLQVFVTWDGGMSWSAPLVTPLRFSDQDSGWFILDFTSATNWTAWELNNTNFAVRVVHDADLSVGSGPVAIDGVRAVVRFQGYYHILGTTVDGEDILSGLLMGAPISMRIGLIVVAIGTLIGSVLGALAGYFGGPFDELIMRITDVFLAIPALILAMAVAAALGRNLDNVMYALIVTWWPPYTRLVRGQTLSVRENVYIEAARASGGSELRVVGRHILPNTLSPILVQASLDVGSVVLVAAGLSFLGLGAQPGTPEWGLMVSKGFRLFPPVGQNWWQVTFSGLMIFLFVLGFNLLGDGVRDIMDPRLRR